MLKYVAEWMNEIKVKLTLKRENLIYMRMTVAQGEASSSIPPRSSRILPPLS